jgi:hypothetical protein
MSTSGKWLLRLGLTALALLITTDRPRRPVPKPPKSPPSSGLIRACLLGPAAGKRRILSLSSVRSTRSSGWGVAGSTS